MAQRITWGIKRDTKRGVKRGITRAITPRRHTRKKPKLKHWRGVSAETTFHAEASRASQAGSHRAGAGIYALNNRTNPRFLFELPELTVLNRIWVAQNESL